MQTASPNQPESPKNPVGMLPYAWGEPVMTASFRCEPEDFIVDERLEVPEHAGGAHWWLNLRKRSLNTKDVARILTDLGSGRIRQVGYAGLKDRHAVTSQWFSMPIETIDPNTLATRLPDGVELLDCRRARHAVRRGGLKANRFTLVLREVQGEKTVVEARIGQLTQGVPNYFGEQRFGIAGGNLDRARALFAGTLGKVPRFERGMYLSAARSQLFNLVLAERVRDGNWNQLIEGEAVILDGSRSWFPLPDPPTGMAGRLAAFDIHPSGPLYGTGTNAASGACAALEERIMAVEPGLAQGLEEWRMRAERRPLRIVPEQLDFSWQDNNLRLQFELPSGAFATVVLRELAHLEHRRGHGAKPCKP